MEWLDRLAVARIHQLRMQVQVPPVAASNGCSTPSTPQQHQPKLQQPRMGMDRGCQLMVVRRLLQQPPMLRRRGIACLAGQLPGLDAVSCPPQDAEATQGSWMNMQLELPTFPEAVVYQQAATAPVPLPASAPAFDLPGSTGGYSGLALQALADPEVPSWPPSRQCCTVQGAVNQRELCRLVVCCLLPMLRPGRAWRTGLFCLSTTEPPV